MNYDPNNYAALGVGDTVGAGHYRLAPTGPVPVRNHEIGTVIFAATEDVYLRAVEPAPIAKTEFATGSSRSDATGRGRFDLIPYEAMLSLARRYEMGAVHFGPRDWEKGQPLSRLLSSMRRHSHQINYDFSEDHMGAVLWNAAAFVTMVSRMEAGILPKELDDIGWFINQGATQ